MSSLSMPAWQGPLPQASPPSDMAIYQLPTGTYDTRAAFAYTGGSFSDKRHFAATAVLVMHPQGDFLIDAGFGADIAAHVHAHPWYTRSAHQAASTARDQLDASGYDHGRLRGVLITHSHWDHVSGLDRLQVPIWTNAGELQYAADSRDGTVFRTVSPGHEIHRYEFGNGPYLGFASSYDVHGDGSVVLALAGGHALRLHRRRRLAVRGDNQARRTAAVDAQAGRRRPRPGTQRPAQGRFPRRPDADRARPRSHRLRGDPAASLPGNVVGLLASRAHR